MPLKLILKICRTSSLPFGSNESRLAVQMARQCLTEPIIKLIVLLITKFSAEGLFSGSLRYPPPCRLVERLCIYYPQSRQSAKPFLLSPELGLSHPLTRTLAFGRGSMGSPIPTRGHTLCGTLNIHVLCATYLFEEYIIYIYMVY